MSDECGICKKERSARAVVAMRHNDIRFNEEPYSTAPYIHQLNEPKHAANLERAVKWAGVNKRSINWVTAHDYPLHRDDQARRLFFKILAHGVAPRHDCMFCVCRCHAHVYTYVSTAEALDKNRMDAKRRRWLQFHDQKTGGIMGLCPLVKGLPVRLTDHVDRDLAL